MKNVLKFGLFGLLLAAIVWVWMQSQQANDDLFDEFDDFEGFDDLPDPHKVAKEAKEAALQAAGR
ncbi:hypothetical protein [Stomatohabitans albus]|uniref:hypothetical protein n=1 Tax=Stomatohabitans albus TaxID=3110766 RepID=UPI00300D1A21